MYIEFLFCVVGVFHVDWNYFDPFDTSSHLQERKHFHDTLHQNTFKNSSTQNITEQVVLLGTFSSETCSTQCHLFFCTSSGIFFCSLVVLHQRRCVYVGPAIISSVLHPARKTSNQQNILHVLRTDLLQYVLVVDVEPGRQSKSLEMSV